MPQRSEWRARDDCRVRLADMYKSKPLSELLRISSEPTGIGLEFTFDIPDELRQLYRKNGFFSLESSLEIFPNTQSFQSYSLAEWNDDNTWLSCYRELRPNGIFFAQDLFGHQFLFKDGIYSFDPETGDVGYFAPSIEAWAQRILDEYEVVTAQPIAHEWQARNGPIPFRHRLIPITPFVLGGAFEPGNLVAMDALAAMRLRADLALQIKNLPDGTEVSYEVA